MEIYSIKASSKTILKQVEECLEPTLISLKTSLVKKNNKYVEKIQQKSKKDNSNQDNNVAQRLFLDNIRNAKQFNNITQGDIKYPHNIYSIYTPVNAELEIDDQFVRVFPILKKYKEDINSEAKMEFYSNISRIMQSQKDRTKIAWKQLVKKWVWEADIYWSVVYYHFLLRVGYKAIIFLKSQNPHLEAIAIEQHLERFTKLFQEGNSLKKNTQFSIDSKEQINEISIVKTAKQLFCGNCLIYDCHKHKLQDHIIQQHNQFIHPKNKPSRQKKIETATKLLNHYYKYCSENQTQQEQVFQRSSCSSTCYLYLNKQKFEDLKYQFSSLLSPSIKALINLGIQMIAYSPCHVSLIAKSKMTCSLVYWYFIKVLNLQQTIERNFTNSEQDYMMSIRISSGRQDKKKQTKKFNNKKKETSAKLLEQYPHASNVTPICFHSFLHKDDEDTPQPCTDCSCAARKFCLPTCLCDANCPLRIKGCTCGCPNKKKGAKGQNKHKECDSQTCPCLKANRECDPAVCHGCYPCPTEQGRQNSKKNKFGNVITCKNNQYQRQNYPRVKLGISNMTGGGLGLFAGQFIRQNSIILTYTGQIIENSLEDSRQKICNDLYFYNFQFNEGSIDAKFFGNKARFINHSDGQLQNCSSKIKFARSDNFLAVYASRDIKKDEQLFFDYDGDGSLYKNHRHKYPFIREKTKFKSSKKQS